MSSSVSDNLTLFSPKQQDLVKMLLDNGQGHLYNDWPGPGVDDEEKKAFFDQLVRLDSCYPGGLEAYVKNAKRLLADSKVLPSILEQVVNSKDELAQFYLMECIIQPTVDIKTLLSQLMDRLSSYAASSTDVLAKLLQVEAFTKLSTAISRVQHILEFVHMLV